MQTVLTLRSFGHVGGGQGMGQGTRCEFGHGYRRNRKFDRQVPWVHLAEANDDRRIDEPLLVATVTHEALGSDP